MKYFLSLFFSLLITSTTIAQLSENKLLLANYGVPYGTCNFDVDDDGDEDYIIGYWEDIVWYENLGANDFRIGKHLASVNGLTELVCADVNADGLEDMFFVDGAGVFIIKGLTDGEFEAPLGIDGLNGRGIDLGDFDGDEDLDIVVSSISAPTVAWYENDGDGNFDFVANLGIYEGSPEEVRGTDLDGDGDLDVAVTYDIENKVAWYENDGTGGFGDQIVIDGSFQDASYIESGDVDNDGDMDLVVAGYNGDSYTAVRYYQNDGDASFALEYVDGGFPVYFDLELFDYDEDGDLDILVADTYYDMIRSYAFNGVDFDSNIPLVEPNNCFIIAPFDANGDSHMDLITSRIDDGSGGSGDIILLTNNGDATYDNTGYINNSGNNLNSIVLPVDLNGDDNIDVLYIQNKKLEYARNYGEGHFGLRTLLVDDMDVSHLATGDVNGDGFVDIIITKFWPSQELFWLENDGLGNFGDPQLIYDGTGFERRVLAADLNEDGFVDVLCAADDKISCYINDGAGLFGDQIILFDEDISPKNILAFDDDGDGDKDVITFSNMTNEFLRFENLDGTSFGAHDVITTMTGNQVDFDFADCDNDGDLDIVTMDVDLDSPVDWVPNEGGTYGDVNNIGFAPEGSKGIKTMDFDDDGDLDIAVISNYSDEFGWFENMGDGTFSADYISTAFVDGNQVFAADFDLDGDIDPGVVSVNDEFIMIYQNSYYSNLQVRGNLFVDVNLNGLHDSADVGMAYTSVISTPASDYAFTAPSGSYFMNFTDTPGTYVLTPEDLEHWELVTDPVSYSIEVDDFFTSIDSLDFGFYPDSLFDDLKVDLTGAFPRCNTIVNYWVSVTNSGTTVPSGNIELTLDDSLTYISSSALPDSIVDQTIYWSYDSLAYFANYGINVMVEMPDFMSDGYLAVSYLTADVDSLGEVVHTNSTSIGQTITCAYDPNDKIATPAGIDSMGYIPPATEDLDYTVRFQNTGSDTAINVVIKDQLDPNVDWTSFDFISSSHPVEIKVEGTGEIIFTFNNIMLPDSNVNEIGSHGFVKYNIELLEGLPLGTSIYNTANIYFDANPAVVTNTKINTIDCRDFATLSIEGKEENKLCSDNGVVNLISDKPEGAFSGPGVADNEFDANIAGIGVHWVYYERDPDDGCLYSDSMQIDVVDCLGLLEQNQNNIAVYPNPFDDFTTINFGDELTENHIIIIHDILGQEVYRNDNVKGISLEIKKEQLGIGIYVLSLLNSDLEEIFGAKLIVE